MQNAKRGKKLRNRHFFHPDYTVGFGISPNRRFFAKAFVGYTTGEELHLAPKQTSISITDFYLPVKRKLQHHAVLENRDFARAVFFRARKLTACDGQHVIQQAVARIVKAFALCNGAGVKINPALLFLK